MAEKSPSSSARMECSGSPGTASWSRRWNGRRCRWTNVWRLPSVSRKRALLTQIPTTPQDIRYPADPACELPSARPTGDAPAQEGVHMPNRHPGSPPSDPSSAPESGTVRDQNDAPQETEEQQYKRPTKRQSNAPDQGRAKSGANKQPQRK